MKRVFNEILENSNHYWCWRSKSVVWPHLNKKPESTQRELAKELGFSLGKLNYCLKALKEKGLVKINNFSKNPNKLNFMRVLIQEGIQNFDANKFFMTTNSIK